MKNKPPKRPGTVIFRRYRKLTDGTVLDAHNFGYKAWPLHLLKG